MKLFNSVTSLAVTITIGAAAIPSSVVVAAGLPGSYTESCSQIALEGSTLSAVCKTRSGAMVGTTLVKATSCQGDIPNWNGNLSCMKPGGSWAETCEGLSVDQNSGEITSNCRRRDQSINTAVSKPSGSLTNCNGYLTSADNC